MILFRYGTTWSDAIRDKNFGLIADWFKRYFFWTGLIALIFAGAAAYFGGTAVDASYGVNPTVATSVHQSANTTSASGNKDQNLGSPLGQQNKRQQDNSRQNKTQQNTSKQPPATALRVAEKPVPGGLSQGLRVFALGLLLAGACTVTGWLFGLLFGVPRTVATAVPASAAGTGADIHPTSQVNTNLESISDWLTKTLIGVGLTQLNAIPHSLGDLAAQINRYGFNWGDNGQLLGLTIILYFVPGGFWLGYIGTRTFLTGLFGLFSLPPGDAAKATDPENLRLSDAGIEPPKNSSLEAIDKTLRNLPLVSINSPKDLAAWGAAQARAGNYDAARVATENALRGDPDNPATRQQLALINLASRRPDNASELLKDAPDRPAKVFAALYESAPAGYRRAIELGEQLAKDPQYKNVASLHIWLACAYGQKYGDLKAKADPQPSESDKNDMGDAKQHVLDEIKTAISLAPSAKAQLRAYWKPAPSSIDNDLSVFPADDADMKKLLESPPENAEA